MTEIKLVAVDLDGTLLNSESEISPQNADRLKKASDIGVKTRSFNFRKAALDMIEYHLVACI